MTLEARQEVPDEDISTLLGWDCYCYPIRADDYLCVGDRLYLFILDAIIPDWHRVVFMSGPYLKTSQATICC